MAENPTTQSPTPPTPTRGTAPTGSTDGQSVSSKSGGPNLDDIAVNMERTRAAQDGGTYGQLLTEVAPQTEPEQLPELDPGQIQAVYSVGGGLPAALRPAVMADTPPPPGMTERGWSIEVTSRHPELMAQALEELAALGDVTPQGTDPVDPTDPHALRAALSQMGNIEVIKTNLRNRAAELNGERLGAAVDKVAAAGEAVKLAISEVLEEAQAQVDILKTRAESTQTTSETKKK